MLSVIRRDRCHARAMRLRHRLCAPFPSFATRL
jgi:hypothetical protein